MLLQPHTVVSDYQGDLSNAGELPANTSKVEFLIIFGIGNWSQQDNGSWSNTFGNWSHIFGNRSQKGYSKWSRIFDKKTQQDNGNWSRNYGNLSQDHGNRSQEYDNWSLQDNGNWTVTNGNWSQESYGNYSQSTNETSLLELGLALLFGLENLFGRQQNNSAIKTGDGLVVNYDYGGETKSYEYDNMNITMGPDVNH
jgi:hypothetical protein